MKNNNVIEHLKEKYNAFTADGYMAKRNDSHDINLMVNFLQLKTGTESPDYLIYENLFFISESAFKSREFIDIGFVGYAAEKFQFQYSAFYHNSKFNIGIHVVADKDFPLMNHALDLARSIEVSEPSRISMLENSFITLKKIV